MDITISRQFLHVSSRGQLAAFRRWIGHLCVAPFEALVETGAQAKFRLRVPLAVGIDAMDKDHDAGNGRGGMHIEKIHLA